MCKVKVPEIKNIVPAQTQLPEAAPEPVKVDKEGADKVKKKRNPLRIDLANASSAGSSVTGVNV